MRNKAKSTKSLKTHFLNPNLNSSLNQFLVKSLFAFVLIGCISLNANAQGPDGISEYYWSGANGTDFYDSLNWNDNLAPDYNYDQCHFDSIAPNACILPGNISKPYGINIAKGGIFIKESGLLNADPIRMDGDSTNQLIIRSGATISLRNGDPGGTPAHWEAGTVTLLDSSELNIKSSEYWFFGRESGQHPVFNLFGGYAPIFKNHPGIKEGGGFTLVCQNGGVAEFNTGQVMSLIEQGAVIKPAEGSLLVFDTQNDTSLSSLEIATPASLSGDVETFVMPNLFTTYSTGSDAYNATITITQSPAPGETFSNNAIINAELVAQDYFGNQLTKNVRIVLQDTISEYHWTGAVSSDFNDPANWLENSIPDNNYEQLFFDSTAVNMCIYPEDRNNKFFGMHFLGGGQMAVEKVNLYADPIEFDGNEKDHLIIRNGGSISIRNGDSNRTPDSYEKGTITLLDSGFLEMKAGEGFFFGRYAGNSPIFELHGGRTTIFKNHTGFSGGNATINCKNGGKAEFNAGQLAELIATGLIVEPAEGSLLVHDANNDSLLSSINLPIPDNIEVKLEDTYTLPNFFEMYSTGNEAFNATISTTQSPSPGTVYNSAQAVSIEFVAADYFGNKIEKTINLKILTETDTVVLNTDATLSSLVIDGADLNFSSSTTSYDILLPTGTTTVPSVTAVANDAAASVSVVNATSLPGTTKVTVTAEDGATIMEYSINFSVEVAKNTDATLASITTSEGELSPAFSASVTNYVVALPVGTTTVPTITASTTDQNASMNITAAGDLLGTTKIMVTAEDGSTTMEYSITFQVAVLAVDEFLTEVYPNPVVSKLSIHSNKKITALNLFNLNGQLMQHQKEVNSQQTEMDFMDLSKGIYILKISMEDGTTAQRRIIKY